MGGAGLAQDLAIARQAPPFIGCQDVPAVVDDLSEMTSGNAVRVIPHHAELTTGEAVDLLNVSSGCWMRGASLSYKVGTHRRALLKDVMAYREKHHRARSAVLDRMAAIDQELGLI